MNRVLALMSFLACVACGPGPADTFTAEGAAPVQSTASAPLAPAAPVACPATWTEARRICSANVPCTAPELFCVYPGVGDGLADGGFAEGLFACGMQTVFSCSQ